MVQPYPATAEVPEIDRPAIPASVLNAIKVMYAGAVVSVIHIVADVSDQGATKTAIEKKNPSLSISSVNTIVHVALFAEVIAGLLGAILFIWIARSCRNGKNWARKTGTVLWFIAILGTVYDLTAATATLSEILNFAVVLIGLAALVLLWRASSSAYFKYFKRPEF
jgi:hypothetical protein